MFFKLGIHHSSLLHCPSNLSRVRWVPSLKVAYHQFMICSVQGFFEVWASTLLLQFFSSSMIFAFASILQLLLRWLLPRPITLKSKKSFSNTPVKILVLGYSHMKTVDAHQLEHGLGGHVVHGVAPARRLSTSHGHPLRAYNSVPHWPNSVFPKASQQVIVLRSFLPQSFNSPPHLRFVFPCY